MAKRYGGCQQNDECDGSNHCVTILPFAQAQGNPFDSGKALLSELNGFISADDIPVNAEPRDSPLKRSRHVPLQPLRTPRGKGIAPGNFIRYSEPCDDIMELFIISQSIPNANNSLKIIHLHTDCCALY